MESQLQNPEFRINPENLHPWNQRPLNLMLSPLLLRWTPSAVHLYRGVAT